MPAITQARIGMTWLLVLADANYKNAMYGNAYPSLGWAGRRGRWAGMIRLAHQPRPQGMSKRLTFTEGRLRLPIGTNRPENQAFRQPRGGPMEAALILRFLLIKEKEGKMTQP